MRAIKVQPRASAEDVAAMHKHLGDAHQSLMRFKLSMGGHTPKTSSDSIHRVQTQIASAMHSLEGPFVARAGRDTPFANPSNPDAWVEWLAAQKAYP